MGMTGIEKIVEQIESAARADAETLLGSGRAESAAVLRDYGLRADALAKKRFRYCDDSDRKSVGDQQHYANPGSGVYFQQL